MARNSGEKSFRMLLIDIYSRAIRDGIARSSADESLSLPLFGLFRFGDYSSSGSLAYRQTYGLYWERRIASSEASRFLYIYSTRLTPAASTSKSGGFSVRCVAQDRLKHKLYVIISLTARDINSLVERREDGSFY